MALRVGSVGLFIVYILLRRMDTVSTWAHRYSTESLGAKIVMYGNSVPVNVVIMSVHLHVVQSKGEHLSLIGSFTAREEHHGP